MAKYRFIEKGDRDLIERDDQKEGTEETTGNGCLDAIIQAIGVVVLVILMLACSCTYMGWRAVRRASEILSIPDKLFREGQTHEAVETYKQCYPDIVRDEDRKRVLERIISHEFASGNRNEAAFWADVAAEEGIDLEGELGSSDSPIDRMIRNSQQSMKYRRSRLE